MLTSHLLPQGRLLIKLLSHVFNLAFVFFGDDFVLLSLDEEFVCPLLLERKASLELGQLCNLSLQSLNGSLLLVNDDSAFIEITCSELITPSLSGYFD